MCVAHTYVCDRTRWNVATWLIHYRRYVYIFSLFLDWFIIEGIYIFFVMLQHFNEFCRTHMCVRHTYVRTHILQNDWFIIEGMYIFFSLDGIELGTPICVWHDSFICVTKIIHFWKCVYLLLFRRRWCRYTHMCATWLIQMSWHDSFITKDIGWLRSVGSIKL